MVVAVAALDAWAQIATSAAGATAGVAYTVSAGAGRMLAVVVGEDSDGHEPTTASYGNVTMDKIVQRSGLGSFPPSATLFVLNDDGIQAASDNLVRVNFDGTHNGGVRVGAGSYQFVDQVIATRLLDTDSSVGNGTIAAALTVTSIADGLIICAVVNDVNGVTVTFTNATTRLEMDGSGTYTEVADDIPPGATRTVTPASASINKNVFIIASFKTQAFTSTAPTTLPTLDAAVSATAQDFAFGPLVGILPSLTSAISGTFTQVIGVRHFIVGNMDQVLSLKGEL